MMERAPLFVMYPKTLVPSKVVVAPFKTSSRVITGNYMTSKIGREVRGEREKEYKWILGLNTVDAKDAAPVTVILLTLPAKRLLFSEKYEKV